MSEEEFKAVFDRLGDEAKEAILRQIRSAWLAAQERPSQSQSGPDRQAET